MSSKSHSSDFDPLSFVKYMKNIGRAYRKQAMELISTCRVFVRVGEKDILQDAHLRNVLEVVDEALRSASGAKNKTSEETDGKFERAISELGAYEQKYHPKQQGVAERMQSAKEKDKTSSKILNRLKQSFKAKLVEGPTKVARFLLLRSLPDPSPRVIEQVLGDETSVEEILWNFSRLKGDHRITLKQNPRFYNGLPGSAHAYSDDFKTEPIENFRDATEIWVLTDKQSRVFLETGEKKRVFGNFWVPDEAIIFKDICGRLEGESVVGEDIHGTPHLWHREEPSVNLPPVGRPNPGSLPPIITDPANTNPVRNRMFEDWRQLVRDTLYSPNVSVCISTKGTPPESPADWVLSSPTSPTPISPLQSFSTVQVKSTSASPGAKAPPRLTALRIPEPSPGPLTALSYKTARSAYSPVSQTPLTVISPPFAPPPTLSPHEPSVAVPHSPARPTPTSQNPVAVSLSVSVLTVATFTPQARPSPSVTPHRPGPPPQQAALTGAALIPSRTLTPGGIAPYPSTTITPPVNDIARSSGLHPGDSPVGNRPSVPNSVSATSKAQAPSPGQKQAESAASPAKGPAQTQEKKKNWFRTYIWDYGKGK